MSLLDRVRDSLDPDRALQAVVGGFIEAAGMRYAMRPDHTDRYRPGAPLRLLLTGYSGTRNTGADVRVEEMIRQFRTIIGDENLELTLITRSRERSAGYFRGCRQVILPDMFPKFLYDECTKHHGVVSCEGSMFKSKFAEALSTMMAGSLGMAAIEGKLSVGYGAEAGGMSRNLENFVRTWCRDSLVICRNEPSRRVLESLGIRTRSGTDTAWTFEPGGLDRGAAILREHGWDGTTPVLACCPINPFWWPVRPDVMKAMAWKFANEFRDDHYSSIYFHHRSAESEEKYATYLDALAGAIRRFEEETNVFVVLVGMEMLDRHAAELLSDRLGGRPVLVSDTYDMYDLVSALRNCTWMVSSRFHAIVTSMPGRVASAGVTMDERIRNLMNDRGHPHLFLEVDEEDLEEKLLNVMRTLRADREKIGEEIARSLPRQLQLMGQMGIDFMDELRRIYPDLVARDLPRTWDAHLPPLSRDVSLALEQYG